LRFIQVVNLIYNNDGPAANSGRRHNISRETCPDPQFSKSVLKKRCGSDLEIESAVPYLQYFREPPITPFVDHVL
jgi:hypothetical protein